MKFFEIKLAIAGGFWHRMGMEYNLSEILRKRKYQVEVVKPRRAAARAARYATPEYQEWRRGVEERKAGVLAIRQRGLQKSEVRCSEKLQKDLRLLDRVIRGIRSKLEFPKRNRENSLIAWNSVGVFKRRKKVLERAYRVQFSRRQRDLERAARKAFAKTPRADPLRTPEEKKLVRTLRRRFEKAFKFRHKSSYILQVTGVDLPGLRRHLESLFQPGMTWENYSFEGWHVDHIRPVASFDLADPVQQAACFHYTNLQPLWKADNLSKGAKYKIFEIKS